MTKWRDVAKNDTVLIGGFSYRVEDIRPVEGMADTLHHVTLSDTAWVTNSGTVAGGADVTVLSPPMARTLSPQATAEALVRTVLGGVALGEVSDGGSVVCPNWGRADPLTRRLHVHTCHAGAGYHGHLPVGALDRAHVAVPASLPHTHTP
jgi:hypothetical protein